LPRTNKEHDMPGNPREMVTMAERHFSVRIRISVPSGGLGPRYSEVTAWIDANCGVDGRAISPSGCAACSMTRSRSFSLTRHSPAPLSPDGARGQRQRLPAGCFRCERINPAPRIGVGLHRTPWASDGIISQATTRVRRAVRDCV